MVKGIDANKAPNFPAEVKEINSKVNRRNYDRHSRQSSI